MGKKTHKAYNESSLGGGGTELDTPSKAEVSGAEKRAPHDIYSCPSLSPFLNSHLEVYIV